MIRGLLFILSIALSLTATAQVTDDFSDGDFTSAPEWTGDVADFEVLAGELHLNAPAASDEAHLVTLSEAIENAVWEFNVRMQVNPSNSNRAKIYLVSNAADLEGPLNGYYVLVGNNANEVSLYRQTGDTSVKIVDGTDDTVDSDDFAVRVRVTKDDDANWTLQHDVGLTGAFVTEGAVQDDTHTTSSYFGFFCDYSTANSTAFYFDEVSVTGTAVIDDIAPEVLELQVNSAQTLTVFFSEAVDPITAEDVTNYSWMGQGNPVSAIAISATNVLLDFGTDFPFNAIQTLEISSVTDVAGNVLAAVNLDFSYVVEIPEVLSVSVQDANTLEITFSKSLEASSAENVSNYAWQVGGAPSSAVLSGAATIVTLDFATDFPINEVQSISISDIVDIDGLTVESDSYAFILAVVSEGDPGEVVINEILADPDDIGVLRDAEYIELYNTSDETFSTEGWSIIDGTTSRALSSVIIPAGGYIIVCDEDFVESFNDFGTVIGLSSFGLTNGGQYLALIDDEGEILDELTYEDDWYDGAESDGVSLERINPFTSCSFAGNWGASVESIGGTPGSENSIFDDSPDTTPPTVSEVLLLNDEVLRLVFNEPLSTVSIITGEYAAMDEDGNVVAVEIIDAVDQSTVDLTFFSDLEQGILYTISVSGVADCSENEVISTEQFYFAIPDTAEADDVLLNEVLFDPKGDGVDYVELYNNSDKYISLDGWILANRDDDGELDDLEEVSGQYRLLRPGHYALLSESGGRVIMDYPKGQRENFLDMQNFPTFSNDEGTVVLMTPSEEIIDEFYYSDDYHFALLDIVDGVSLERISFDRLTNDPTNWHSASESSGFGTPGYENSQSVRPQIPSASFVILPEIFSPDNDGIDDVATISYSLEKEGYVAKTDIFDRNGRLVRQLNRNKLLGREGSFTWDGIADDRSKAPIGIYIVYIEVFDLFGNISSVKKTVVLGGKLN